MKNLIYYIVIVILISCNSNHENKFFTISVDSAEETNLSLSEIAENIEAVELELTDNSLLSVQRITRILYKENFIIVSQRNSVMLFDKTGKFIRQIGSIGQGPGEFAGIQDIAADFENKNLFILAFEGKIICYDFDGNLIKESPNNYYNGFFKCVYYINGKFLLLAESALVLDEEKINRTVLYTVDKNLLKTDSIEVRKIPHLGIWFHPYSDFINYDGENTYFYYSDISQNPFVLDTLYQLKNNEIKPYLNLSFKNNGIVFGEKEIYLFNIYRSMRYVFSFYQHQFSGQQIWYYLCYDVKTNKGYKVKEGFTDDIHTGEKIKIRPFNYDTNKFYYLHTIINDSEKEEPNPTLYIGTLKK